jgi:hypothetical protein
MRDNLVMDLLMRGSSIIPFSVFGNDVNNVPEPSPLILIDGLIYRKIGGEMVGVGNIITTDSGEVILLDSGETINFDVYQEFILVDENNNILVDENGNILRG